MNQGAIFLGEGEESVVCEGVERQVVEAAYEGEFPWAWREICFWGFDQLFEEMEEEE